MLSVTAFGKINWTLDILGRREDGYHRMDMLMQSVALGDELCFAFSETIGIQGIDQTGTATHANGIIGTKPLLFDESNLIVRCAKLLKEEYAYPKGVSVRLIKKIPFGAGMGGGSADAAATLLALNRLWRLNLPLEKLCELGLRLGADIPFMLYGGLAHVEGIGEKVTPLAPAPEIPLLCIQTCGGVSTGTMFKQYDQSAEARPHPSVPDCIKAVSEKNLFKLRQFSGNVLQPVLNHFDEKIEKGIQMLYAYGADFAQMTGSGSVLFGAFSSDRAAASAYCELSRREEIQGIWLTHTLGQAWNFTETEGDRNP